MSFGQMMRDRRKELGLTQEYLSQELGYKTNSYISDVELGKFIPPKEKLNRLSKALKWKKAEFEGIALQGRLMRMGFGDSTLTTIARDLPGMSKEEKQQLIGAYESILKSREKVSKSKKGK